MKYMNHLRKLALLSSLALSFGVQADGTLPLPIQDTELPLKMTDPSVGLTLDVRSLKNAPTKNDVNGVKPCTTGENFYSATGTVRLSNEAFVLKGVCKPTAQSLYRKVVAVDADATKLALLQGTADNPESLSTFTGELHYHLLVDPASLSNPVFGPEAGTFAPVEFELRR